MGRAGVGGMGDGDSDLGFMCWGYRYVRDTTEVPREEMLKK